jgi:branched-chain amino acid aminotransferase
MESPCITASYILINDTIVPYGNATVHVNDRGFLFGDAVYETIRAYRGSAFLLAEHLQRLRNSASSLYLTIPWSDDDLTSRLGDLLLANKIDGGRIRITVTRGFGDVRARPEELISPTLVITADPLTPVQGEEQAGVRIEVAGRIRNSPDALDPAIKSGNLLNNLLARFEMRDRRSFEVLLPNHLGEITEGSISNFFIVDGEGCLRTPALASGLLPGITRALVLDLARLAGVPVSEIAVSREDCLRAEEIFLTASTIEILPVAVIDHQELPRPVPGEITRLLQVSYRRHVEECLAP